MFEWWTTPDRHKIAQSLPAVHNSNWADISLCQIPVSSVHNIKPAENASEGIGKSKLGYAYPRHSHVTWELLYHIVQGYIKQ
jgi:hypothetical protein